MARKKITHKDAAQYLKLVIKSLERKAESEFNPMIKQIRLEEILDLKDYITELELTK